MPVQVLATAVTVGHKLPFHGALAPGADIIRRSALTFRKNLYLRDLHGQPECEEIEEHFQKNMVRAGETCFFSVHLLCAFLRSLPGITNSGRLIFGKGGKVSISYPG